MQPTPGTVKPQEGTIQAVLEPFEDEFLPVCLVDSSMDAFLPSEPGSGNSTIADWLAAAKLAMSERTEGPL